MCKLDEFVKTHLKFKCLLLLDDQKRHLLEVQELKCIFCYSKLCKDPKNQSLF